MPKIDDFCGTNQGSHNFVVVSWNLKPNSKDARELMCSNCLRIVDLYQIRQFHTSEAHPAQV